MLLRFLRSMKTFLNYVTGVHRYLKVIGGISYSQADSRSNAWHGKSLVFVCWAFFHSVLIRKQYIG